jgi:propane monooxygenase small subunit
VKRAFALVVAVESYGPPAGLARLDHTVDRACEFVEWLLKVRGADPHDIFLCTSPEPAALPPQIQGVRSFGASREVIRSAVAELGLTNQDTGGDVFLLFSGHGARSDGKDVLMASDYRSGDGGNCIPLDEIQAWLPRAMGRGTHYWFVEACRTGADFPISTLALPKRTSDKGWDTPNRLFATAAGTAARAQSKFPQALLGSLHGKGPAKAWLEGSYWVTFPVVVDVVGDAVRPEGMDVDPQPAFIPGRILQLAEVPEVTVTIDIRGAEAAEEYQLALSADRPPVNRWITWPGQRVNVPPGLYYASLLRDGRQQVSAVSPPEGRQVPIYDATRLEFDCNPLAEDPDAKFTVAGPSTPTARSLVSQGAGKKWLGPGAEAEFLAAWPGPLTAELFDRDEHVGSAEYRGKGDIRIDSLFGDRIDLSDLSHRAPTEAVIDPDPALRLALSAAAAIGDIPPYTPAIAPLEKFDNLGPSEAGVYVITPPGEGAMTVHSGIAAHSDLRPTELTVIKNAGLAFCHGTARVEPAMAHRVFLQIPRADMAISTVALAGRVTVIVVQPERDVSTRTPGWRIHQFALQPGHLSSYDRSALLPAVRFSALVQRRIGQERPAMAADPDPEHVRLWTQILEGHWPDPMTMLIAAYELVRRGALAGNDRNAFLGLLTALRAYGPAFDADLAVLGALADRRDPQPSGEPLTVDGVIAAGGESAIAGPTGMALDYRGAWTRWRVLPTRQRTSGPAGLAERSVPRPVFTDAEVGAKIFPDSTKREFNYFTPAGRRRTRYEDVTVEVQPDPRHYLSQGWLYGFSDGSGGYPLDWTALKAWGSDRPEPERYPGSGGKGYDWPAHGWHEFRDPNEEWELTLYRYNANVVRQLNQNIENARQSHAFEQWNSSWVRFVESNVGAWMHVSHGLGLYLFANANRRAPTNMHNNAISVNSMHRIRSAQDLALYNQTLSEEVPGFDGTAHLKAWNEDPTWQGVREVAEQLTGIDDWCEAIFAANVVFEPLVGELFRSQLVMQAAPRNGDYVTPTLIGAEEYDYAERDLRYTRHMFQLLTADREFADHNKSLLQAWLSVWVSRAIAAARTLQPLWSQPEFKPSRFEDGLDAAKSRFNGIVTDLDLATPKELAQ